MSEVSMYLPFVSRSDLGPPEWMASIHHGNLPSILQTSRQTNPHSFMVCSSANKGLVPVGVKE